MANFDSRVMNNLNNLQKRPLDDDTCQIYMYNYITCIKALGLVVLYIHLFWENGPIQKVNKQIQRIGVPRFGNMKDSRSNILVPMEMYFQKEYQCALWMHYVTVKVTRSNILVPIKRSWYKEYTCEIWKLCLIVQKL